MSIIWYNFKDKRPDEKKKYLIAYNNWNGYSSDGIHYHSLDVNSAIWDGNKFFISDNAVRNPDQWSELPYPPAALPPSYYEENIRKVKEMKKKKLLDELAKLDGN